MSSLIDVVAAVVRSGRGLLVCQRPAGKRHGGLWEFPGGKVLRDETFHEAIVRELEEELSLGVTGPSKRLGSFSDEGSPYVIHFMEISETRGEPVALEHSAIEWVGLAELEVMELAPADRGFVDSMLFGSTATEGD
ncbi:MAG: (deoxy)nucleoside triphosphate pyrophosphohydrolase [Pseudomonadota bacterium]